MRFQLLSDLHLEFHADGGDEFLRTLDPKGVDALILAGDVHVGGHGLARTIASLCAIYPRVLFVVGNHEYYRSSPDRIHRTLQQLNEDIRNFDWLHHRTVEIDGVRVAGTTMWFPLATDAFTLRSRFEINDFNLIRDFDPWVYDEHRDAMAFLTEGGPKADVIVTHHVPSFLCVPARFRGQRTNHYFTTDMTAQIDAWRPKLWCFGHTHDRMWLKRGKTLLVSNPFGYPTEQALFARGGYAERCLIEVNSAGARFAGDVPGWPYPGPMQSVEGPIVVRRG